MVANAGQVLDPSAANEHHRVLLQVVTFAADITGHFKALVNRTLATLRMAELGFFGVVVYTRVQTPRRWGEAPSAGTLLLARFTERGFLTS